MRYLTTNTNLTAESLKEARLLLDLNLKKCTICYEFKELREFPTASKSLGGVGSMCKCCASEQQKEYRSQNKSNLLFRLNRAILKKQRHETHICWIADKSAHQAAAHLLGKYGLLSDADSRMARAIFMNNRPERLNKLREQDTARSAARAAAKEARTLATAARVANRESEKQAAKLARQSGLPPAIDNLTDEVIEDIIYSRLRYHLKKKHRQLKIAGCAFTKQNFTDKVGYSLFELRDHLTERMPCGKTWVDVATGELHIEHVIPGAAFDLSTTAGVRNCYAISNLTLLPAYDNSSKGGKSDKSTVAHFRNDTESAQLFGLCE